MSTLPHRGRTLGRLSTLDWGLIVALVVVAIIWGSADNVLQEIEALVLACFVALVYIGLQVRR